jgi:predicted MFS family arabinose efflux permease
MAGPILVAAVGTALLPLANSIWIVAAGIILLGLSTGPFDIGLFTLRQRRTDPAWFGRAFAVSMSLNSVGNPIGSALAGPLIGVSLNVALWAAVAATLASLVIVLVAIPSGDDSAVAVQLAP